MKTAKLSENCSLNRLPPELLTKIAAKLDWPDQIALLSTSKRFAEAAKDDALVAVRDGVAADIAAAPAAARRPDDVLKLWRVAAPRLRTAPLEPVRNAVRLAHDMQAVLRNPSRLTESSIPGLQAMTQEVETQIGASLPSVHRLLQRMIWMKAAQRGWHRVRMPAAVLTAAVQLGCTVYMVGAWSRGIKLPVTWPSINSALGAAGLLMMSSERVFNMLRDEDEPSPYDVRIEDVAFLRVAQAREARKLQIQKLRLDVHPHDAEAQAAHDAAEIRMGELSQQIASALANA